MLDTALLLTREPKRALVDIINHHNGTIIEPSRVSISQPQVVSGRKTKVTVTSTNAQGAIYTGQVDFTFNRLDLAEFFAPVTMDISIPYPATTLNVLSALSARFGMVMGEEDFIIEEFNTPGVTTYTLSATPDSLRWYGSVSINLDVTVDLSTHFNVTTLDGLTAFPAETPLQNLYQIVVLNGLTYGDAEINISGTFLRDYLDVHWVYGEIYNVVFTGDYLRPGQDVVEEAIRTVMRDGVPETAYSVENLRSTGSVDQNSAVDVIANGQGGIVGSQTVTFNRSDIGAYLAGQTLSYELTQPVSDLSIAQAIAAEFNFFVNAVDFDSTELVAEEIPSVYTLTPLAGSWRWIGSVDVTIGTNLMSAESETFDVTNSATLSNVTVYSPTVSVTQTDETIALSNGAIVNDATVYSPVVNIDQADENITLTENAIVNDATVYSPVVNIDQPDETVMLTNTVTANNIAVYSPVVNIDQADETIALSNGALVNSLSVVAPTDDIASMETMDVTGSALVNSIYKDRFLTYSETVGLTNTAAVNKISVATVQYDDSAADTASLNYAYSSISGSLT